MTSESAKWSETKADFIADALTLGPYMSFIARRTPRRLLHMLSYYKFAAKMIGADKSVLDVGCSEGFGTQIVAEFANKCVGVDLDRDAITCANASLRSEHLSFICADILCDSMGNFDAVVSFDVIEHIYSEHERDFMAAMVLSLVPNGLCVIGTPNITSDQYSSAHTHAGHVNLYSEKRLRALCKRYFNHVFMFSANDELVHTGFSALAHYLIALCVSPIQVLE